MAYSITMEGALVERSSLQTGRQRVNLESYNSFWGHASNDPMTSHWLAVLRVPLPLISLHWGPSLWHMNFGGRNLTTSIQEQAPSRLFQGETGLFPNFFPYHQNGHLQNTPLWFANLTLLRNPVSIVTSQILGMEADNMVPNKEPLCPVQYVWPWEKPFQFPHFTSGKLSCDDLDVHLVLKF